MDPAARSPARSGPPAPNTARTPEQHEAVRRRAWPIAFGGALCAFGGLFLLANRPISFLTPPNVYALNLSFCAMLIGIGILFYARGTSGTRLAVVFSLIALVAGAVGPLLFARQSITWHIAMEAREKENVASIARAAYQWALSHDGHYPASLDVLLDAKLLLPEDIHSPFGNSESIDQRKKLSPKDFDAWYARHSDYSYFGGDLDLHRLAGMSASAPSPASRAAATAPAAFPPLDKLPSDVILATSFDVIMSTQLTAGFMDGHADFLDLANAEAAVKATNAEREKMGLPEMRPPGAVQRAEEQEREDAARSQ